MLLHFWIYDKDFQDGAGSTPTNKSLRIQDSHSKDQHIHDPDNQTQKPQFDNKYDYTSKSYLTIVYVRAR